MCRQDLNVDLNSDFIMMSLAPDRWAASMATRIEEKRIYGAGTYLKNFLSRVGIVQKNCNCGATMSKMDSRGPQWVRENMESIITEVIENASRSGMTISAGTCIAAAAIYGDADAVRVSRAALSLTPIRSALREALIIACERAENPAPPPLPTPPQPPMEQLPPVCIDPIRRKRVDPQTMLPSDFHFNSSVVLFRGEHLLAYRMHWYQSRIGISVLDRKSLTVQNNVEIKIPRQRYNMLADEDPRLFVIGEDLWLEIIGLAREKDKPYTSVGLIKLDPKTFQPTQIEWPEYVSRRSWEKNWGFFDYRGRMLAVYNIPGRHMVIGKSDTGKWEVEHETTLQWPERLGDPRGGACPVLRGNEYYNWCHCVMRHQGQRWYSLNLYTFDAAPPFRPARVVNSAIVMPSVEDRWNSSHPNVVFPAGVALQNGKWLISYGYHDKYTEFVEFGEWDIEQMLEPIKGGTYDISCEPGWHDTSVWRDVYVNNAYELPDQFKSTDTIVDIGGHIGSFSKACLERGAGLVVAVEPEFGKHWKANLASYGDRARLIEAACGTHTARSCVQPFEDGLFASKPTFKRFPNMMPLAEVLAGLGPVRLLKLDCEGPEFSLVAETNLSQVKQVIGETHPHRDGDTIYSHEGFLDMLRKQGFTITKETHPGQTGLFWAERK